MATSQKLPILERLLIFTGLFCFGLLLYHCIFTFSLHYTFLLWNLLLAFVPYIISRQLVKYERLNFKSLLLFLAWLLFFPACVYLFKDMLRLHKESSFSFIYEAVLFACFALTGLLAGLMSLKKIETFLQRFISAGFVKVSVILLIFLSSFSAGFVQSVHLKSWNVAADFKTIVNASKLNFANSIHHLKHLDANYHHYGVID